MPARLMEIELRVADVERSRHFYRDLIGVPVGDVETHGTGTQPHVHATWGDWSGADPSLLMLNIYPADPDRTTATRFGFVVPDLDAVDERLRAASTAVIEAPQAKPWGRSAIYRDPDGNTVSLTEAPR
jgi:predicted enzyme related to lactoylglutathione lyase